MMRRGETGEHVRRFQEALLRLGYPLPRWGADGQLGTETLAALNMFLRDHWNGSAAGYNDHDDLVSDEELRLVEQVRQAKAKIDGWPAIEPIDFHDRRSSASQKHVYGLRRWVDVTGICLHQTACVLGERPARWDSVGCHVGVTRGGQVMWLHDFTKRVVHGNAWNTRTVGIELDGLYAGVEGRPDTVWDDPSTQVRETGMAPTEALIDSAKAVVRWVCETVAAHGGKVINLVAHRQSSRSRRNDPGSALWQSVALPLMDELGLNDGGPRYAVGGYPIPEDWDSTRTGIKY